MAGKKIQDNPLPLISVVLPTYNGARHLEASIESCLSQTYENLELIVVDDGSPDPLTGEILGAVHDPRMRVLNLEKNVRLPRALNAGFREAKGEFLTWTSDDNFYRPEALETMARRLTELRADFVYARATAINEKGGETGSIVPRPPERLVLDNCIGPCFLYTRRVMRATGEFDPEMLLTEDYDYWIRVSKRFRMVPIQEDLYLYRFHDTTLTSVHGRQRVDEMIDQVRRRHFSKGRIFAAKGLRAFDRGERAKARGLLLGAWLRQPFDKVLYYPLTISLLPRFIVRALVRVKAFLGGRWKSI